MAILYKICTATGSATASILLTNGTCATSFTHFTDGQCEVYEKRKTLTFTASLPSTENYYIYYSYTVTNYVNFDYDGVATYNEKVLMLAGHTTVTTSVLCDRYAWCTSGDALPTDRYSVPSTQ